MCASCDVLLPNRNVPLVRNWNRYEPSRSTPGNISPRCSIHLLTARPGSLQEVIVGSRYQLMSSCCSKHSSGMPASVARSVGEKSPNIHNPVSEGGGSGLHYRRNEVHNGKALPPANTPKLPNRNENRSR